MNISASVSVGKTKITVTSAKNKAKKATIKVVVQKIAAKKVKLSVSKLTLAVGKTKKLKATVTPKKASKKIEWTSSKKKVATVSSAGVVKGKKAGTATITAKAADGSGKKATCKVTVGNGIKSIKVPHSYIVTVSLNKAKANLAVKDFKVQTKSVQSRKYATTNEIEKVRTQDGGKTYDLILDDSIYEDSYVKVTLGKNSLETFVEKIADYGYGENPIERVQGTQGKSYSSNWYIYGCDTVGAIKYSVTGLPAGLKAYVSKDKTSVNIRGVFTNVENGTTATLTGVDEKGKTVKKSYVFYVGNKKTITGNVLSRTVLSFVPDNPETKADEETGYNFLAHRDDIVENWACISGGSGSYEYSVSGLPAVVDTMTVEGRVSSTVKDEYGDSKEMAITAGTYNAVLTVRDEYDPTLSAQFPFTITVTDGVTVSGSVKDAPGTPVKYASVYGATKMDAYGFRNELSSETKNDGTYATRVIPGNYYTSVGGYNDSVGYDLSVGNNFAAASVKDFALPTYKVSFTTTIAGAVAYTTGSTPYFVDQDGRTYALNYDRDDYTLYAYLRAGSYEMQPAVGQIGSDVLADIGYNNTIYAYTKVSTEPYKDGVKTGVSYSDRVGERAWQVSCAPFTVAGAASIQLTGAMLPEGASTGYDW